MGIKPTQELILSKTEVYMMILMINSIIDEFYDELSQISYIDMFEMIDEGNIFSFFEKYKENGAVQTLMYLYKGTPKIAEINYLMVDMLGLDYPKKCCIEFKGIMLLSAACLELYINYELHRASYNGERTRPYRFPHHVGICLHLCDKAFEPVRKRMKKVVNFVDHLLGYC